jgi:hypothetical protein
MPEPMHMKCTFGMQTLKQSDRPADVAGHLGVSGAPTVQNNVDCASARGKATAPLSPVAARTSARNS